MLPTLAVGLTAIAMHSSPLTLLSQAWLTLDNETLSSLDLEELESTFRGMLEAKQLDTKNPCKEVAEPTGSLDGVTEKELFSTHCRFFDDGGTTTDYAPTADAHPVWQSTELGVW
ncbi:hypothetical protein PC129_g4654 [Phytophthora cactorum]|uniref:Uncharacterized protein n=2 Tax=Phytophthora cactorum TaxID=29920 RepID=A0A8T1E0J5_9STRA|nr:hypothetical protein Pcac1_g7818 [Phytophthora cactorum]KAG2812714.1 hypothetical protein PC111_g14689 [Phytophthora cactorum]KAG2918422.1 hypothetical protein PC114_g6803 [Phytophthora cactorum]KAG2932493.1 hypothetical protein PC115_g5755 [Phytophthora cactorum]KAG2947610.1 hypothetical protein PC117_g6675 [Phytophthora cactorum]